MSLSDFIGKVVTAPIKIVVAPIRVLIDVAESDGDSPVKAVTDSIERQIKDIVD